MSDKKPKIQKESGEESKESADKVPVFLHPLHWNPELETEDDFVYRAVDEIFDALEKIFEQKLRSSQDEK